MSKQQQLTELLHKFISGTLTEQENQALMLLLDDKENEAGLDRLMRESFDQSDDDQFWDEQQREEFLQRLLEKKPAHRVYYIRKFIKYAAAVLLILGAAAYIWIATSNNKPTLANGNKPVQTDVAPGGEHAVLTLADGRTITLDTAANGQLASQGGVQVVKLANGQIAYDLRGLHSKEVMWNTLSTPRGGQYQITLPDGTKVWLNASSSITFPTAFVANKREVKITGEIYFEVTKNKQKPFVVDVNGTSQVEVLGTSFNVNAYSDEAVMKTTLLEGSVRQSAIGNRQSAMDAERAVVLKPGEQAVLAAGIADSRFTIHEANVAQVLAWKNGIFDFTGADLKAVMRQLERWYDIKVQYKGTVSNIIFEGRMYRNVNLSDVLQVLQEMGVKFELNGKTLTVQ